MRTYGRDNHGNWFTVVVDSTGFDDDIWLTTLAQVLTSNLNESPFYANYGLPARDSIIARTHPDYWISIIQGQFAQYFTSLTIQKTVDNTNNTPTYHVEVIKNNGATASVTIMV